MRVQVPPPAPSKTTGSYRSLSFLFYLLKSEQGFKVCLWNSGPIKSFYSPESNDFGAIFLIFSDSRQTVTNANSISTMPETAIKTVETVKVHFTIPIPLKNNATNGLIITAETISPTITEIIVVGINDNAVCRISCGVVYPKAFIIPYSRSLLLSIVRTRRYSTKTIITAEITSRTNL